MNLSKTTLTLALLAVSSVALAAGDQDLQAVATNVTENLGAVGKLISAASYVAGVGFALAGIIKLKAHQEQPTQVHLSAPIVLIVVAAGLIFLPSLIQTAGETIFGGGGKTSAGSKGEGLDIIK
jgi:intracellular multiplication protein IcmD